MKGNNFGFQGKINYKKMSCFKGIEKYEEMQIFQSVSMVTRQIITLTSAWWVYITASAN